MVIGIKNNFNENPVQSGHLASQAVIFQKLSVGVFKFKLSSISGVQLYKALKNCEIFKAVHDAFVVCPDHAVTWMSPNSYNVNVIAWGLKAKVLILDNYISGETFEKILKNVSKATEKVGENPITDLELIEWNVVGTKKRKFDEIKSKAKEVLKEIYDKSNSIISSIMLSLSGTVFTYNISNTDELILLRSHIEIPEETSSQYKQDKKLADAFSKTNMDDQQISKMIRKEIDAGNVNVKVENESQSETISIAESTSNLSTVIHEEKGNIENHHKQTELLNIKSVAGSLLLALNEAASKAFGEQEIRLKPLILKVCDLNEKSTSVTSKQFLDRSGIFHVLKHPNDDVGIQDVFSFAMKQAESEGKNLLSESKARNNYIRDHGNTVGVSGLSGIGKTSFARMFIKCNVVQQKAFKFVFTIPLSSTDLLKESNLLQFLVKSSSCSWDHNNEDDAALLREIEGNHQCLIIIDGLDNKTILALRKPHQRVSLHDEATGETFLQNLLSCDLLPSAKKIFTFRPDQYKCILPNYKPRYVVRIKGISESSQEELCHEICGEDASNVLNYLHEHPNISSYCLFPPHCILIMKSIQQGLHGDVPQSLTGLLVQRLLYLKKEEESSKVQKNIIWFKLCQSICLVFQTPMETFCKEICSLRSEDPELILKLAFGLCNEEIFNRMSILYSGADFQQWKEKKKILRNFAKESLSEYANAEGAEILLQVCDWLFEAQDQEITEAVASELPHEVELQGTFLRGDISSFHYLLQATMLCRNLHVGSATDISASVKFFDDGFLHFFKKMQEIRVKVKTINISETKITDEGMRFMCQCLDDCDAVKMINCHLSKPQQEMLEKTLRGLPHHVEYLLYDDAKSPKVKTLFKSNMTADAHQTLSQNVIGKAGRKIDIDGCSIIIPPDALDDDVCVSFSFGDRKDENVSPGSITLTPTLVCSPDGLEFHKQITITLTTCYEPCNDGIYVMPQTNKGCGWTDLKPVMYEGGGFISFQTSSFCRYSVNAESSGVEKRICFKCYRNVNPSPHPWLVCQIYDKPHNYDPAEPVKLGDAFKGQLLIKSKQDLVFKIENEDVNVKLPENQVKGGDIFHQGACKEIQCMVEKKISETIIEGNIFTYEFRSRDGPIESGQFPFPSIMQNAEVRGNVSFSPNMNALLEEACLVIENNMPGSDHHFMRQGLRLLPQQIKQIETQCGNASSRKTMEALECWRQKEGEEATAKKLVEILNSVSRKDVADIIQEIIVSGKFHGK